MMCQVFEKLYQAVVARNHQANLQPTLNKRAAGARPTIFVTSQNWKNIEGFFKDPEICFLKKWPVFKRNCIGIFIS